MKDQVFARLAIDLGRHRVSETIRYVDPEATVYHVAEAGWGFLLWPGG